LELLGAKISRGQSFNGFGVEEYILTIELGPDFRGSEQDLRRLKWLPDVELLILAGPKATDAWLKQAAAIERLSELHLYETAASDAGLAAFAGHASLTQVGIYYTPISDEALPHLQKLPGLNFMKLYGTKITRGAVEKFQAATGLAKVDHRKGAFLGVGCQNFDGACVISTVHESSPAEKAGLERDDQLVRFGDVKTADFEALTAQISQRDVAEEVEIEVQRQALDDQGNIVRRSVITKVKLGPWEQELAVRNGMRP
jgi:membrane-associated protease RseP (regulator of RpoE activity)